jgi:putative nucleotidyltransferase with HDIG domain
MRVRTIQDLIARAETDRRAVTLIPISEPTRDISFESPAAARVRLNQIKPKPHVVERADILPALERFLGATPQVLPELEALRGVEQNPNHHLDVHSHTIEVMRRLLEVEADLERYAGGRAPEVAALLAEPLADELTRGGALRFGAVVHDMGKPATRGRHGDYVTFIGHDREGAVIVGSMCERLKASRRLTRHLQGLTLHHLRLGFLARERPLSRRRTYEYLRDTDPVGADVTLLTVADRLAARGQGPIAGPEMVQAHLELASEMLGAALDWRRDGPPKSPIPGDELAAQLGISPGPELGRIIGEVEAAVYAGEVGDADDAVAFARRLTEPEATAR